MSTATESLPTPTPLPLFYRTPALLRFPEHRQIGIREVPNFGFAADAPALPVVIGEFLQAQRSYPIVFSMDAGAAPLAVTSFDAGKNLFVAADGTWDSGHYVPSYVRRYPFIGMTATEGSTTMLGLDLSAPHVSTDAARDAARPLFAEEGAATEAAAVAMAFCDAYAREHERTRAFCEALEASKLLAAREARVTLPDGTEKLVHGFRLVDEAAFRALSGPTLETFHASGWTDLIVLHLASQNTWQTLATRANANKEKVPN